MGQQQQQITNHKEMSIRVTVRFLSATVEPI